MATSKVTFADLERTALMNHAIAVLADPNAAPEHVAGARARLSAASSMSPDELHGMLGADPKKVVLLAQAIACIFGTRDTVADATRAVLPGHPEQAPGQAEQAPTDDDD